VNEVINPYKRFQGVFIPNAIMECREITQSEKLVWGRLAQFSGKDGECHPSMEQIADGVGISERQAKRAIKALAENGFIMIVKPSGKERLMHWRNRYLFLDHPCFSGSGSVDQNAPSGGDTSVPSDGVVSVPSKEVTPVSPPRKRIIKENHIKRERKKEGTNFALFWQLYPKKKSKGNARKAFEKLGPSQHLFEKIMDGLNAAVKSKDWEQDGGKWIPYPATWLNAEGWEDEHDDTPPEVIDYKRRAKLRAADRERRRLLKEKNKARLEANRSC